MAAKTRPKVRVRGRYGRGIYREHMAKSAEILFLLVGRGGSKGLPGKNLREIEQDVALNEMILRSLVLHVDDKHVDTMLTIARDEHALALQVAPEAPDATDIPEEDLHDSRGPRRGRREG